MESPRTHRSYTCSLHWSVCRPSSYCRTSSCHRSQATLILAKALVILPTKETENCRTFRFYKRNQLKSENAADYLAELRRLALTCEFDNFLNEALCDRFICGLLTKALTLAQSMETAQQDLKEIHTSTTVDNDTSVNASAHHISSKKQLICHRCLGTGHLPAVCRFKSAKCHKTGKRGILLKHV